ncbi:MAG: YbaN family protein [Kangiellaceae bacterium]
MLSKSLVVKYSLILCGLLLVLIGLVGIIVPGLPTTIFLILAAACFAKSSPSLHQRLLEHPWFGPIIENWNNDKSIPRRAKQLAIAMIAVSYGVTWYTLSNLWLKLSIGLILVMVVIYLIRLPVSIENEFEDS